MRFGKLLQDGVELLDRHVVSLGRAFGIAGPMGGDNPKSKLDSKAERLLPDRPIAVDHRTAAPAGSQLVYEAGDTLRRDLRNPQITELRSNLIRPRLRVLTGLARTVVLIDDKEVE
jgi:hypothetical protein